jgi:hypothetical protein
MDGWIRPDPGTVIGDNLLIIYARTQRNARRFGSHFSYFADLDVCLDILNLLPRSRINKYPTEDVRVAFRLTSHHANELSSFCSATWPG